MQTHNSSSTLPEKCKDCPCHRGAVRHCISTTLLYLWLSLPALSTFTVNKLVVFDTLIEVYRYPFMLFYTLGFLGCFLYYTSLFLIRSRFTRHSPSHTCLSSICLSLELLLSSRLLGSEICLKQGPGDDFWPCLFGRPLKSHQFWEAVR